MVDTANVYMTDTISAKKIVSIDKKNTSIYYQENLLHMMDTVAIILQVVFSCYITGIILQFYL